MQNGGNLKLVPNFIPAMTSHLLTFMPNIKRIPLKLSKDKSIDVKMVVE
jgi:hypothetical protein